MARILELRKRQEREAIGNVPIPVNLRWLVAEKDGVVVACAGGAFTHIDGQPRTAIVCEFYDDGSIAGKQGLCAILDDANRSNVDLYAIIPNDRPGLMKALANRGFDVTGIQMTRRRDAS